jgi:hypothetical protein
MNMMWRAMTFGLAIACATLGGCTSSTEPGQSDLSLARQRWASSNIRSYDFTASRSCFCAPQSLRSVTVSVTDGVVTRRVFADTGEPVPESDSEFSTVEGLFDIVQAALTRHAARVDASYDPVRGVPISISIDGNLQVADDEVYYGVSGFRTRY